MLKRTPLYDLHQSHGGKLIEFGGWEMPVQYTSIMDEHLAVRKHAGIFDISHMGEIEVFGPGAAGFLNRVLTNDITRLAPGVGQYTLMCNEQGGVVDDLYAYQLGPQRYLLIINASRIDADTAWLRQQHASLGVGDVRIEDLSEICGAVAVQGPAVAGFMSKAVGGPSLEGMAVKTVADLKKNEIGKWLFQGNEVWVSRTGYTGEDGFEVVSPAGVICDLWKALMIEGAGAGLKPCGLGARDTLRTEVCYPLYGHELDEATTPIEAGVGFFVALGKDTFNGKPVFMRQKAEGTSRKLVAFRMEEKSAPPRPHYAILDPNNAERIGEVTSGTQSPSLGVGIGLGYVAAQHAKAGSSVAVEIRGRRFPAVIVPKPIYRKPN